MLTLSRGTVVGLGAGLVWILLTELRRSLRPVLVGSLVGSSLSPESSTLHGAESRPAWRARRMWRARTSTPGSLRGALPGDLPWTTRSSASALGTSEFDIPSTASCRWACRRSKSCTTRSSTSQPSSGRSPCSCSSRISRSSSRGLRSPCARVGDLPTLRSRLARLSSSEPRQPHAYGAVLRAVLAPRWARRRTLARHTRSHVVVRVTYVSSLRAGGPLSHIQTLAPAVAEQGLDVSVVCADDRVAATFRAAGIETAVVPLRDSTT